MEGLLQMTIPLKAAEPQPGDPRYLILATTVAAAVDPEPWHDPVVQVVHEANASKTSPEDRAPDIAASELRSLLKAHERHGRTMRFAIAEFRRHPFLLKAEVNGADARTAEGTALVRFRESPVIRSWLRTVPVRKHGDAIRDLLQRASDYLDEEQDRLRLAWERIYRDYWHTFPPSVRDLVWLLFALAGHQGPRVMLSHRAAVAGIALVTGAGPYDFSVIPKRAREHLLRAGISVTVGKASPEHPSTRTTIYDLLSASIRSAIASSLSTSPRCRSKGLVDNNRSCDEAPAPDYPRLMAGQIQGIELCVQMLRDDKETRARALRREIPALARLSAKDESRRLLARIREMQAQPKPVPVEDLESLLDPPAPARTPLPPDTTIRELPGVGSPDGVIDGGQARRREAQAAADAAVIDETMRAWLAEQPPQMTADEHKVIIARLAASLARDPDFDLDATAPEPVSGDTLPRQAVETLLGAHDSVQNGGM
jgi:hypothetical protein